MPDPASALIVCSTITLAHGLGMRVVAEGVEDEAMLAALTAAGCDLVQGYLLGRPVAPAAFVLPHPDVDDGASHPGRRAPVPAVQPVARRVVGRPGRPVPQESSAESRVWLPVGSGVGR